MFRNAVDVKREYIEHKHDEAKSRFLQYQMRKESELRKKAWVINTSFLPYMVVVVYLTCDVCSGARNLWRLS